MYHEPTNQNNKIRKQHSPLRIIKVYVPVECYEVYDIPFVEGESLTELKERIRNGAFLSVGISLGNNREFNQCRVEQLLVDRGTHSEISTMESGLL